MDRKEHLEWAKNRAYELLTLEGPLAALTSLTSDLNKHDELRGHSGLLITRMLIAANPQIQETHHHIEGFN